MDPVLQKAVQDYKEKQANSGPAIDCVELERCFREFKTELYIKRDEVNQFRTELNAANLENQNLKKALDVTKKALDENQFNLNIQLKRASSNEEFLKQRESLMKIQLQHKMAVAEIDTLKEILQKNEMEKIELSRKVDVLEAKQRHSSMYYNEILKRDNQLRNFMTSVNEMAEKLQAEHVQTIELSKKNQLADEALQKLKACVEENEKLKKEKERFEEMYIKTNAKSEKLEELLAMDSSVNNPNLLSRIVFNQWKLNRSRYETQMKQQNDLLNKITESFTKEKSTNVKLISENDGIKEKNNLLEAENLKLKELCKENSENIKNFEEKIKMLEKRSSVNENGKSLEENKAQIKEEPIEIIDD